MPSHVLFVVKNIVKSEIIRVVTQMGEFKKEQLVIRAELNDLKAWKESMTEKMDQFDKKNSISSCL